MIYFAQHKPSTQYLGYNCPITETPHFKYVGGDRQPYIDYLLASWGTSDGIEQQCEKFDKLIIDIRNNGQTNPIELCRNRIVDGNHRAAVLTYYDKKIRTKKITADEFLLRALTIPDHRYGSPEGVPYQSLYFGGREVVVGRRRDTLARQQMIGRLDGKTVIDFGCNVGASSILAAEYGAVSVLGVESVYDIAVAACRVNAYYGCENIRYDVADLSGHYYAEPADVGFVFSIDFHVNNNAVLADNIRNNVKEVVFYECHTGRGIPDEVRALFGVVDHIGTNHDGREFFRCWL